jgi:hypothetical protein
MQSVPISIRLSPDLRERLVVAAGDRGLGEEIRQRLEASFKEEPPPSDEPEAKRLFDKIDAAHATIEDAFGAIAKLPLEEIKREVERREEIERQLRPMRQRFIEMRRPSVFSLPDGEKDE